MEYQLELSFQQPDQPTIRGQPDEEAIRMIREFEPLALRNDPRGYCVCTSEGKDSRVLGHLMRRAGVRHFYLHSISDSSCFTRSFRLCVKCDGAVLI